MLIKIGIAEDHQYALNALLSRLKGFDDIEVCLLAKDGKDLLEQLSFSPVDLVLMDIEMPRMDGITATREVKELFPEIKVLMLTTFDDDEKIFNAILAGASGYLLKEEAGNELHQAIINTVQGGAAMSASIALKALQYIKKTAAPEPALKNNTPSLLTHRETEILEALKNGWGYKQIAARFFISEGTVRKHIENIYQKLQVHSKLEAVLEAQKRKLI